MNWLQGGVVVFQPTSALVDDTAVDGQEKRPIDASDSFGRGNHGGLSSEQLYDMTELWNCFNWLVQGLEGRTEQARQFGVFDNTEVRGGDIDGEEAMLGRFLVCGS